MCMILCCPAVFKKAMMYDVIFLDVYQQVVMLRSRSRYCIEGIGHDRQVPICPVQSLSTRTCMKTLLLSRVVALARGRKNEIKQNIKRILSFIVNDESNGMNGVWKKIQQQENRQPQQLAGRRC